MKMKLFPTLSLLLVVATGAVAKNAITPTTVTPLFNGKDLSAFDTWLVDMHEDDPECVFSVVQQIDGAPAIRVSGKYWGGLITKERYTNYRLIAEFRWGELTWDKRVDRTRDSGILLHCQGEPGNSRPDFNGPWMRSIEYQIIEGGTGDIILVGGHDRKNGPRILTEMTCPTDGKSRVWKRNGTPTSFNSGRIDWYGRDPKWKDVLGFRGRREVEKPVGEWNRIEIISDNDRLTYFLNGKEVNGGTNASLQEGKLLFQSEGAEIFFRVIELHPLKK